MASVAVIGGGVVGLFSALTLSQRGHEVTVFDDGRFDQGCSFGNSGLLVPSHFVPLACPGIVAKGLKWLADPTSPFRIKPSFDPRLARWCWLFQRSCSVAHVERSSPLLRDLALESLAQYRHLAWTGFREAGLYMGCTTIHGLEEEAKSAEVAMALGLRAEVLDEPGARKALPGFEGAGAVHYPEDGQIDPSRLMEALVGQVKSHGVALLREQRVCRLALDGGSAVAFGKDGSPIDADWLVVAAGSRSAELLRPLGHDLPLVGGKGYSFVVEQPSPSLGAPVILVEDKVAISPLGGQVRLGGTLEIGTKPGEIDIRRVEGISTAARAAFPQFGTTDPPSGTVWSGQRPCTPDGLPYIGGLKGVSNLTVATGHAMLGMTLAPATSRIVADCVEGGIAPSALDPMRFS
ncbi:MAG: FAD-dependent oxidoreductase [Fimbriimonadaceae bacterium]|nr:FAD-dependent oxidoreductase [Fimbriimonadaceae bacterium]QYK59397.1 MAG: FAD-dependent oxidoreductase [Fimbriimonadaceae bacterium]